MCQPLIHQHTEKKLIIPTNPSYVWVQEWRWLRMFYFVDVNSKVFPAFFFSLMTWSNNSKDFFGQEVSVLYPHVLVCSNRQSAAIKKRKHLKNMRPWLGHSTVSPCTSKSDRMSREWVPCHSDLWQYRSFSALSSSMSVLFWFSKTATRFSKHLTYSFFFRRHSRAASLQKNKNNLLISMQIICLEICKAHIRECHAREYQ